jgi:hypothetical protein
MLAIQMSYTLLLLLRATSLVKGQRRQGHFKMRTIQQY